MQHPANSNQSFDILGHRYIYTYPDFGASIVTVVIVEVVVVVLLTGGGVGVGGQN